MTAPLDGPDRAAEHDDTGAGGVSRTPRDETAPSPSELDRVIEGSVPVTGLARVAGRSRLTPADVLAAMGGVMGLIEALMPGMVFLLAYTLTRQLVPSLIGPVVAGIVFLVIRIVRRQPVQGAVAGLAATALSAFLAMRTGDDVNYFVLGFFTSGGLLALLALSLVVRRPLLGFLIGPLYDAPRWYRRPRERRMMAWLTLIWVVVYAAKLLVQLPLYFAGDVEALGITRLVMGTPLSVMLLVVSYLFARALYGTGGQRASE